MEQYKYNYTVIIPHYNTPDLLQKAIDSVPRRGDVQLIVVDDNSDPNKVDFPHFPGLNDDFVQVYLTKEGKGAGYARNVGLEHAEGKWITFLDADDFFKPAISDAMDEFVDDDSEVIYFTRDAIKIPSNTFSNRGTGYNNAVREAVRTQEYSYLACLSSPVCRFLNHSFLEGNNPTMTKIRFNEIHWADDVVFTARVSYNARKFKAVDKEIYTATESDFSQIKNVSLEAVRNRFYEGLEEKKLTYERFPNCLIQYKYAYLEWLDYFDRSNIEALKALPNALSVSGMRFVLEMVKHIRRKMKFFRKSKKIFSKEWYFRKFSSVYKLFASKEQYDFIMLKHRIRLVYEYTFHSPLHLCRPQTLNEKLIWLSLYWRNPIVVKCADKFAMRDYVTDHCGLPESLLVPLLGVWSNSEDIEFDLLPNRFVLKCNHGCGYNILVHDKSKMDVDEVRRQLNIWLELNYKAGLSERHYEFIKPHLILAEEFLDALSDGESMIDYKIFCINGDPKFVHVCYNRDEKFDAKIAAFTLDWKQFEGEPADIAKPSSLHKMLEYAKVLSRDFPFVRVDFYDVNGKPLLGELTFTPYGNMITYFSNETLLKYGKMLKLPRKYKKY